LRQYRRGDLGFSEIEFVWIVVRFLVLGFCFVLKEATSERERRGE